MVISSPPPPFYLSIFLLLLILFFVILPACREVERPGKLEQQAVPQTNHVNNCSKSSSQPDSLSQPVERGEGPSRDAERAEAQAQARMEVEVDGLSPDTAAPSRPTSTLPSTHRNGLPLGTGVLAPEQNGGVVYKRGVVQRAETEKQVQRKTALAQVEHWVKVQKGEPKRSVRTETLQSIRVVGGRGGLWGRDVGVRPQVLP